MLINGAETMATLFLKKGRRNEQLLSNCIYVFRSTNNCISLHATGGSVKKKTKKLILEILDFWPLTIVVPLMLIGIVLGAALGWGG